MMNSIRHCRSFLFVAITAGIAYLPLHGESAKPTGPWQVKRELKIGGEGRWDYVTFDPASKRLYVPRSTHTQVIQTDTGAVVGDLKDTPGVHGVALATDLGRGFTSNGKGNSVTVFDLKTLEVLGTFPTGQNPDAIYYDSGSKKVFVFNGKSKDATVIDATAAKFDAAAVVATIPLGGKPETPVSDNKGRIFVTLEDLNAIGVINIATLKLSDTWPMPGGDEPSGLAIDRSGGRLFAGCCGNNVMVVIDLQTRKVLTTLPIGKGVDGCGFDPATSEAFASCGDGTLTVIKETKPGTFEVVQTASTATGARTMTIDPSTHTIYLPTADNGPAAAGQKRPNPLPGTFKIIVVERAG